MELTENDYKVIRALLGGPDLNIRGSQAIGVGIILQKLDTHIASFQKPEKATADKPSTDPA